MPFGNWKDSTAKRGRCWHSDYHQYGHSAIRHCGNKGTCTFVWQRYSMVSNWNATLSQFGTMGLKGLRGDGWLLHETNWWPHHSKINHGESAACRCNKCDDFQTCCINKQNNTTKKDHIIKIKKLNKTRDWCLYWQTLGVREERKVKLGSILFTSFKIQTMLKLRNTLPLEYFFFSTSGLDRK